ncbi:MULTISPECIES: DUF3696 domain-containing protein [Pectobacterium]|uniref:AAA domain-containing protein n=1 Tax=Pectobacterium carotovorum subsp. carotovorum (strain PC1) TaxID=561230 RepID=C6DAR7_PECCP|nr:DUF3696 domain-containing protein [Pectobacterium carotovorum]ACT13901.1 conserved hypothetical protein [Pectobacterium carotovorum subsp. carotovorum PC1]
MKLIKLVLTNFRSFKETQVIQFAPVTLLFGPNSVGKTTILMALFYLQQILEKGQCNPIQIESMGDKKIGGFKSLVHGGDLNKEIGIGVEFLSGTTIGKEYSEYIEKFADLSGFDILRINDLSVEAKKIKLDFIISWSFSKQTAYVRQYKVTINDEYFGTMLCNEDIDHSIISDINFCHTLINDNENSEYENNNEYKNKFHEKYNELVGGGGVNFLYKKSNEAITEFNSEKINMSRPVFFKGYAGGLPILGELIQVGFGLESTNSIDEILDHDIVIRALTQIFISPLDKFRILLKDSIAIGPVRVVPESSYKMNPYPEQKNWFNGSAAWDILYKFDDNKNDKLIDKVNYWFSEQEKLNTGYKIIRPIHLTEIIRKNILGATEDSASCFHEPDHYAFFERDSEPQVLFMDIKNDLKLYPSQVGIGLSQILPIIVAAHFVTKGFIAIEQPELHIHPAFQVVIGDLFIQSNEFKSTNPMFIVETHSEHIILRILKRIRQTTEKKISQTGRHVTPEDISIIYLQSTSEGIIAKKQNITEDGDFEEDWPNGFFDERDEELF